MRTNLTGALAPSDSGTSGTHPAAPGHSDRVRHTAVGVVAFIALVAAIISYSHALDVVRAVGTTGCAGDLPRCCRTG